MMTTKQATPPVAKIELTPLMRVGHAMVNQAMGLDTGLTVAQLEHIYADLEDEAVCDEGNALLTKLLGADWNVRECSGCDQCNGCDEDADEDDGHPDDGGIAGALAESVADCESDEEVIAVLSATLMNVAKVNGMPELAMVAHKIWYAN